MCLQQDIREHARGVDAAAGAVELKHLSNRERHRGFSAIELIGVLAILVIMAALLGPRIWGPSKPARAVESVNQARVAEALVSLQAAGTAAAQHCARFGALASRSGTAFSVLKTYDRFDEVLLTEQLLEQPFAVRLGNGGTLRLVNVSGFSASTRVDGTGGAYDLDGRGANGVTGAAFVLEAVISGLTEAEARALNDGLDGPALGADAGGSDCRGRVIYRAGEPGQLREVHVHIMHR